MGNKSGFEELSPGKSISKELGSYLFGLKVYESPEPVNEQRKLALVFRIDVTGKNKNLAYLESVSNHFNSGNEGEFLLINDNDTLKPAFYHPEKNFNLASFKDIIIFYDIPVQDLNNKNLLFIYNDKLLETGPINFPFLLKI